LHISPLHSTDRACQGINYCCLPAWYGLRDLRKGGGKEGEKEKEGGRKGNSFIAACIRKTSYFQDISQYVLPYLIDDRALHIFHVGCHGSCSACGGGRRG